MKSLKVDTLGLPHYQCHKEVWAGIIVSRSHDGLTLFIDMNKEVPISDEWPFGRKEACIRVDDDFLLRNPPAVNGSYLVIYENGDMIISPKNVFEKCYSIFEEEAEPEAKSYFVPVPQSVRDRFDFLNDKSKIEIRWPDPVEINPNLDETS
jgi:hypothetical protein